MVSIITLVASMRPSSTEQSSKHEVRTRYHVTFIKIALITESSRCRYEFGWSPCSSDNSERRNEIRLVHFPAQLSSNRPTQQRKQSVVRCITCGRTKRCTALRVSVRCVVRHNGGFESNVKVQQILKKEIITDARVRREELLERLVAQVGRDERLLHGDGGVRPIQVGVATVDVVQRRRRLHHAHAHAHSDTARRGAQGIGEGVVADERLDEFRDVEFLSLGPRSPGGDGGAAVAIAIAVTTPDGCVVRAFAIRLETLVRTQAGLFGQERREEADAAQCDHAGLEFREHGDGVLDQFAVFVVLRVVLGAVEYVEC